MNKRKVNVENKERVYKFFGLLKSGYYGLLGVKTYFLSTQEFGKNMIFP